MNRVSALSMRALCSFAHRSRGVSLVEIVFAVALLALVAVGYMGALSTSVAVNISSQDHTTSASLAQQEIELLRATDFHDVPYALTDDGPRDLEEVPDYLANIVANTVDAGTADIRSTGTFVATVTPNYFSDSAIADGISGLETQVKWVGTENGPFNIPGGDWPPELDSESDDVIVGGGGTGGTGGVVVDPTGRDGVVSEDAQHIYVNFNEVTRIHRLFYDNTYNGFGDPAKLGDPDTPVAADGIDQSPGIYQKAYKIFTSVADLRGGVPFNPQVHDANLVYEAENRTVRDAGNILVFDNVADPLEGTLVGVTDIYTLNDDDPNFHFPYAGEFSAYGFREATAYIPTFTQEDGAVHNGNYIMFFEKYAGSEYDLARRVYVEERYMDWPPSASPTILQVEIEVMLHERSRNTREFMEQGWWQTDSSELVKVATAIYEDAPIVGGVLPDLPNTADLPFSHTGYRSNEDFMKVITVPGALSIRMHFDIFDLQRIPGTDFVQFFDAEGNQYGLDSYFGQGADTTALGGQFSPWVEGDTIIIRFRSDSGGSSLPPSSFGGVRSDYVEVNGVPEIPTAGPDDRDDDVLELFGSDVYPHMPADRLPPEVQPDDGFFENEDFVESGEQPTDEPAFFDGPSDEGGEEAPGEP